jgi:hypothetical protein
MVAMFENFISVTQEEDVPQVEQRRIHTEDRVMGAVFKRRPSKAI